MHPNRPLLSSFVTLALVGACAIAHATDDAAALAALSPADPATPQQADPAPVSVPATSAAGFSGSAPVDAGRLAALRGGDDTIESSTSVDGGVHDNIADHVVSGSNFINDDAFASASGLNTVIQNTGSNVLIQNGMSVQVIFVNPGQ